ncbi:hydrogenase maturation nickel metallochaperone HypA [Nonomuraea pusilla]|uniref:hydrogenase maturation nickel metallochaperone HypA n=1 Tax=Nonomuraea pusilla TaxID=46177 RepID=UPI00331F0578
MHEFGLCEGLVDLIEERAGGRTVTGARVRVGAGHAVSKDAFEHAFAEAAAGTAAGGAVVDVVITPLTVRCRECGGRAESMDALAACPVCGGEVEVSGGDELVLESVEYGPADGQGDGHGQGGGTGEESARVPGHPR